MARWRWARVRAVVAGAAALAVTAVACTDDNPQTELPCSFYLQQVETGAIDIDAVPEELRADVEAGCPDAGQAPADTANTTGTTGPAELPGE